MNQQVQILKLQKQLDDDKKLFEAKINDLEGKVNELTLQQNKHRVIFQIFWILINMLHIACDK